MNTPEDHLHVELTKINVVSDPECATALKEEYIQGGDNDKSPFIDYTLKGHLLGGLEEGKRIAIARYERNGIKVDGFFQSSKVDKIERAFPACAKSEVTLHTKNSVYLLKYLPPLEANLIAVTKAV